MREQVTSGYEKYLSAEKDGCITVSKDIPDETVLPKLYRNEVNWVWFSWSAVSSMFFFYFFHYLITEGQWGPMEGYTDDYPMTWIFMGFGILIWLVISKPWGCFKRDEIKYILPYNMFFPSSSENKVLDKRLWERNNYNCTYMKRRPGSLEGLYDFSNPANFDKAIEHLEFLAGRTFNEQERKDKMRELWRAKRASDAEHEAWKKDYAEDRRHKDLLDAAKPKGIAGFANDNPIQAALLGHAAYEMWKNN